MTDEAKEIGGLARFTVRATCPADMVQLVKLFQVIDELGRAGCRRSVTLVVDGDGSAKYQFWVQDGEELKEIPRLDGFNPDDIPVLSLGE